MAKSASDKKATNGHEHHLGLKLNATPGLGPRLQRRLYTRFGSAGVIERQSSKSLQSVEGIGPGTAARIEHQMRTVADDDVSRQTRRLSSGDLSLVSLSDSGYPPLLREIDDPPPVLWVRGQINVSKGKHIGIVGTRRASAYGRRTAHRLAFQLASAGLSVVSGLAYGIDRAAHEGALDAGGMTIAVLGSGLDRVYPREHTELARRIARSGCLLSELPPDAEPEPHNFPVRNRIISGLCQAVIVVEAFERAGALITSRSAIDQNRDVYIVPGRLDEETSRGANLAILKGEGQILCSIEQVLSDYRDQGILPELNSAPGPENANNTPRSSLETAILQTLEAGETHIDDLEIALEYPGGELWAALLKLECDDLIHSLPGNRFEASSGRRNKARI